MLQKWNLLILKSTLNFKVGIAHLVKKADTIRLIILYAEQSEKHQ